MIELTDTNSAEIAAEFVRARIRAGSPAMGMVMTLIVVVDEDYAHDAMERGPQASHEHPARVLGVILGDARGHAQINAQVGIGDGWTGETALIRLKGEVVKHPESVVLPLLLPDSPVAVWWPSDAPDDPAADPLGRAGPAPDHRRGRGQRGQDQGDATRSAATYAPGNTDLAWTRITPWRALLAAALDQHPHKVTGASVTAERISPSADLLVAWLSDRLQVPVDRQSSDGPGHHRGRDDHQAGDISISRARRQARDVHLARASRTGRSR